MGLDVHQDGVNRANSLEYWSVVVVSVGVGYIQYLD